MGIILKLSGKVKNFFYSARFRFLIAYLFLMIIILGILNIYPVIISRNLIFSSKETMLLGQVSNISSALSSFDNFSGSNITQVMKTMEIDENTLVAITDSNGKFVYEARSLYAFYEEYVNSKAIRYALEYNDVFISKFKDGAFFSYASMPVICSDKLAGTVLIFEFDKDQGNIIINLQKNLFRISIAVFLISLLLGIIVINFLSQKVGMYLNSLKNISDGNYTDRLQPGRTYEFAKIAQEINLLAEKIDRNEEVRRRFVSDASHELKTPLASIKLLSDSIMQSENIDIDTIREFVHDIGTEAERLARITEKLLALTRIDNKTAVKRCRINLANVVSGTVKILTPLAKSNNIKFNCNFENDCYVLATEDDMYQIALNLMENAVKYNNPNGSVNVTVKKFNEIIEFVVDDTGIGIPDEAIPFVFDRFYRVDKARSREAGGSGLGLSIVKATVEEHGGSIRAEKKKSGGTRFIVHFRACVV